MSDRETKENLPLTRDEIRVTQLMTT